MSNPFEADRFPIFPHPKSLQASSNQKSDSGTSASGQSQHGEGWHQDLSATSHYSGTIQDIYNYTSIHVPSKFFISYIIYVELQTYTFFLSLAIRVLTMLPRPHGLISLQCTLSKAKRNAGLETLTSKGAEEGHADTVEASMGRGSLQLDMLVKGIWCQEASSFVMFYLCRFFQVLKSYSI